MLKIQKVARGRDQVTYKDLLEQHDFSREILKARSTGKGVQPTLIDH